MDIKECKKLSISYHHCILATVPEIPYVQDVLYILTLSPEEKYYSFALGNHQTYINNLGLTVAVLNISALLETKDEDERRRMIAQTIIELCPQHAKCQGVSSYIEAVKLLGQDPHRPEPGCQCEYCEDRRTGECADEAPYDEIVMSDSPVVI